MASRSGNFSKSGKGVNSSNVSPGVSRGTANIGDFPAVSQGNVIENIFIYRLRHNLGFMDPMPVAT